MAVRLYYYHGSAAEPQPIVIDWDERQVQTQDGGEETFRIGTRTEERSPLRQFSNMSQAEEFVEEDGSAQIGGIGAYPAERVPALEHYRLVKVSESQANRSGQYQRAARRTFISTGVPPSSQTITQPSWVKVFERVPGATVTADGLPANVSVRASVNMRVPTTGETFTYRQETRTTADGELSMTLPYATTDYAEYGPETGYTNVSVRAVGPYVVESTIVRENDTLSQYEARFDVSEGRVNGDVSGDQSVTFERTNPFQNISLNDAGPDTPDPSTAGTGDRVASDGAGTSPSHHTVSARSASVSSPFAPLRD
jgi:dolichyl-diphosphooligosaccharide--protein glycosyltransferase